MRDLDVQGHHMNKRRSRKAISWETLSRRGRMDARREEETELMERHRRR
jgi:hypothetical protein